MLFIQYSGVVKKSDLFLLLGKETHFSIYLLVNLLYFNIIDEQLIFLPLPISLNKELLVLLCILELSILHLLQVMIHPQFMNLILRNIRNIYYWYDRF